ncbi:hypothetical protein Q3H58_000534 [Pseudomonas psychrotolerans]|nr:hypothetical protein [Pseudomonas psychrotolerans]
MAQLQQVPRGEQAAMLVIDADVPGLDAFQRPVHQHQRDAQTRQGLGEARIAIDGGDHQAVDPPLPEHAQIAQLLLGIVVGVAEDDAIALAFAVILDATGQLGEVGVDRIGYQYAEGTGGLAAQGAGHAAGHIAQFGDGGLDLLPRPRAYRAGVVHHVGHRGVGDAGAGRDVLDGGHQALRLARWLR